MKKILMAMFIMLFTASSVFCGEFEDTLKMAEQGNAVAQCNLGIIYFNGQGVTQDYKQAVYWYKKAAEQGDAAAQYNLGVMYANGEGVPQDYKQAVYWYKQAAEQGHADAQYNLGVSYSSGNKGVHQDHKQAAYWYTKAAELGHANAQFSIGDRYWGGTGITQDYNQALFWYTKAAKQGHANAQLTLCLLYNIEQEVAQDYKRAVYWCSKTAEQGHAYSQLNLGTMYYKGQGVTQDYKQAAYWWKKAAEQGDAGAQYNLGVSYYNGQGVTQNFKLAYVWESLAAAQGHEDAINNRDITAKKLSSHQLSEAQDLAAKIQYRIDNPEKPKPSSVVTSKPKPIHRTPTPSVDEDIRWVQQTLKNLGYDPGPVDGLMGARTRDAIIAFQTYISVAPTGVIDEVLIAQLRQISKNNQESSTVVTGTGFLISNDGYILTCHHVVEDAARIEIYIGDKAHPASLVRSDPNNDLAILKINGSFPALAFSPHRSAKMGQDVFTVGYPNPGLQGVSAKYTKGTVSSLTGFKDDLRLYQISVPIQPGNSGGALLDENGNILGVVIAMLNAKKTFEISGSLPQNVNYAVKSLYAQAMLDTMPEVAEKLIQPQRGKSDAIDNAQKSTVMVVCYD
jgi:hypothetical protein